MRTAYTWIINGEIHTDEAFFGPGATRSRSTGKLEEFEVRQVANGFLRPGCYASCMEALGRDHLLVLEGPEGSGKRMGGIALLMPFLDDGKIIVLSPSMAYSDLASDKLALKPGQGYLVPDHTAVAGSAVLRFDVERLAARLAAAGAYLVVTTESAAAERKHVPAFVRPWSPPPLSDLLAHCLAVTAADVSEADRKRLDDQLEDLDFPRQVTRLVALVLDKGLDEAFARMGDAARCDVVNWLENAPGRNAQIDLTVVAFLNHAPERRIEQAQARLRRLVEDARYGEAEHGSRPFGEDAPIQAGRRRVCDLTVQTSTPPSGFPDAAQVRRVRFRVDKCRDEFIRELHDGYGYELWMPLSTWLDEQAERPFDETSALFAQAMAVWAKFARAEVEMHLQRWSDSLLGARLTAATVLSCMTRDPALKARAWELAIGWTKGSGVRRASTAAIALGGALGREYGVDALNRLWFLSTRAQTVQRVARLSMVLLYETSVEDARASRTMLRFVHRRVRKAYAENNEPRLVRAANDVALALLSSGVDVEHDPAAAYLLLNQPEVVPLLGGLWCLVLRSAPHRKQALNALVATLRAIGESEQALAAARELGAAVRDDMSAEERHRLRQEIAHAAEQDRNRPDKVSRAVVSALLSVFRTS